MTGRKDKETIDNLVGAGNTFKGEFNLTGPLRVDGTILGEIVTNSRIHISRTGHVEGNLEAKAIDIGGTFTGNLKASEHIIIRSKAYVKANILANTLEVEEGAIFTGQCKVNHKITKTPTEKKNYNKMNEKKLITTN